MTIEQLLQLVAFSPIYVGVGWYVRIRYGPALRARSAGASKSSSIN